MKRAFVQYPYLRSTTKKFDPCYNAAFSNRHPDTALSCDDCRVYLMSDRFLGDQFQNNIMGRQMRYPYTLIADTWDCNFRCWFCYSHHYWSENKTKYQNKINVAFISPEDLARQYVCKIRQMQRMSSPKEREKPLSMLRISGGEPLYATPWNQIPGPQAIDYNAGIDFWISFFSHLNDGVKKLIAEKNIFFVTSRQWKTFPATKYFPVALQDFSEDDGTPIFRDNNPRLIIRFDTNGLLFSDHNIAGNGGNGKTYTERFVGKLYELHQSGKLDTLCIRLTISFKGSTPTEFDWCESKVTSPVTSGSNDKSFSPADHPQYSSYVNVKKSMETYAQKDRGFTGCLYLNPERGVMHQLDNNVWVFYKGAIDWDNFSTRTGIPLSPVRNDFSLITDKNIRAMLWRYVGKGAGLIASYHDGNKTFSCAIRGRNNYNENRIEIDKFAGFYKAHRRKNDFKIIIFP